MTTICEEVHQLNFKNGGNNELGDNLGDKRRKRSSKKRKKTKNTSRRCQYSQERCENWKTVLQCPRPGLIFSVECTDTGDMILVNICIDDVIDEMSFSENGDEISSLKIDIPHAVIDPKKMPKGSIEASIVKNVCGSSKMYVVYDIFVNSNCLTILREQPTIVEQFLSTICQILENKFALAFEHGSCKILTFDKYAGTFEWSQSDSLELDSSKQDRLSSLFDDKCKISHKVPEYVLKYIDHDLQDTSIFGADTSLDFISLEIDLPGINRASEIEVMANGRQFHLETSTENYMLDLNLSNPVNSEPNKAQFDLSTSKLYLEFSILPKPKIMTSCSIDSGVEMDLPDHLKNFDEHNVKESSEERSLISPDIESDNESTASSTTYFDWESLEESCYNIRQNWTHISFEVQAERLNILSIRCEVLSETTAKFYYSKLKGGTLPILYGLVVDVSPIRLTKESLNYFVSKGKCDDRRIYFSIRKNRVLGTIKIGTCIDNLCEIAIPPPEKNHGKKRKGPKNQTPQPVVQNIPESSGQKKGGATRRPRVRTTTGSFPKGILKDRVRTLSESALHFLQNDTCEKKVEFLDQEQVKIFSNKLDKTFHKDLVKQTSKSKKQAKKRTVSLNVDVGAIGDGETEEFCSYDSIEDFSADDDGFEDSDGEDYWNKKIQEEFETI